MFTYVATGYMVAACPEFWYIFSFWSPVKGGFVLKSGPTLKKSWSKWRTFLLSLQVDDFFFAFELFGGDLTGDLTAARLSCSWTSLAWAWTPRSSASSPRRRWASPRTSCPQSWGAWWIPIRARRNGPCSEAPRCRGFWLFWMLWLWITWPEVASLMILFEMICKLLAQPSLFLFGIETGFKTCKLQDHWDFKVSHYIEESKVAFRWHPRPPRCPRDVFEEYTLAERNFLKSWSLRNGSWLMFLDSSSVRLSSNC